MISFTFYVAPAGASADYRRLRFRVGRRKKAGGLAATRLPSTARHARRPRGRSGIRDQGSARRARPAGLAAEGARYVAFVLPALPRADAPRSGHGRDPGARGD